MKTIYIKKMSYDFLFQAVKILHTKDYDKSDLSLIYEYIIHLTDNTILSYIKKNTIISYNNDYELLIEIIDKLVKIFESEEHEEYEKCNELLRKKDFTNRLLLKIDNE